MRTCRRCGHPEYRHRSNLLVGSTKVGDAVPCWHPAEGSSVEDRVYCGCTADPGPIKV